ncbi:D-Ala-D-Ala carboxypeptidase family metallohydrolase [Vitiosangium sp. GDMCC 1.1324]|uniref:D-Ala-D-Ala carboxypeptidase family metallohydrolase n=1 Tax=Vitiosangium sp. (strain GDMCC 1.1324) TaxID=2138576 RepID=UPI000D331676|nr:D-Ala-D-Ala carboxypeptidase family metallohydrolase [Vitiosangium sp. GDMCC 1.1324]PTL82595.1 hypothetical protein DAT35_17510 [Vitiosangium sp. GDMCC 1.1324]
MSSFRTRLPLGRSAILFLVAALLLLAQYAMAATPASEAMGGSAGQSVPRVELLSRGFSGALRAVVVPPGESLQPYLSVRESSKEARWFSLGSGLQAPATVSNEGLKAPDQPGIWTLDSAQPGLDAALHAVITPVHFDGSKTHLNGYHIGRWPARAAGRTGRYAPPELFIEVTPRNQDFAVSEHFRLRNFLTKDQADVWPKYLVLDLRLVDKLELVIQELRTLGHPAKGLHVMSGFRTPQYNGPGENGRAKFSRHTYGDAADVWLDDDGDGQMDDLDGNGRIDAKDAEVLAQVVERVEQRVPALTGGCGLYRANPAHGPFVHIDVRGTPARWTRR